MSNGSQSAPTAVDGGSDMPGAGSGAAPGGARQRRQRVVEILNPSRFSGVYMCLLFIAIFSVWVPDTFLTDTTARSIADNQAITAILCIGLLVTLSAGAFDLSIAHNLGFSAVLAGYLMTHGVDPVLAVVITLAGGTAVGIVNGAVVAGIGVNSFIATLGMSSVLLALTGLISDYQQVGPFPSSVKSIASQDVFGVPILFVYMLGFAFVAWYLLEHTPLGRSIQATGANPEAAALAGIRTRWYVFASLVVTGVVASAAGVLLGAKLGTVSVSVGPPYLLPVFAACFLGTTQLKPGRFNVWGTLLALLLLAIGVTGLQLAGGDIWITDLFNGVALIGAVSIAVIAESRRRRARLEGA